MQRSCLRALLPCLLLLGGAAAAPPPGYAQAATAIVGDWLVEDHGAIIRIRQDGDRFDGSIAWQLHDRYGPEDGPALDGKVVTDRNNPDPALRGQPLTGLRLLTGLRYDATANKWTGGQIYNTSNGRSYHCEVRMEGADRLVLRGYVGIPLFGKDTTWSRVVMRAPVAGELPYVMVTPDGTG